MITFVPHEGKTEAEAHHASFIHALFDAAGVWAPITLALVGGAVLINVKLLYDDLRLRVNVVPFAEQMKKLLAADNADRAVKICRAIETTAAAKVALAGLESREHKNDARAAMLDVRARYVSMMRKGLFIALGLGTIGLIESAVMVVAAVEKEFPQNEVTAIAVLPALLACVMVVNAVRFGSFQRDLDVIVDTIR